MGKIQDLIPGDLFRVPVKKIKIDIDYKKLNNEMRERYSSNELNCLKTRLDYYPEYKFPTGVLLFEKNNADSVREKVTGNLFKKMGNVFYNEETGLYFRSDEEYDTTIRYSKKNFGNGSSVFFSYTDAEMIRYIESLVGNKKYRSLIKEYFEEAKHMMVKKEEDEGLAVRLGLKITR